MNVRFYTVDDENMCCNVDIGTSNEAALEQMYNDFQVAVNGFSTKQYEETVRGLFQQRLASVNAYGIATTLYVAMTTDPTEMGRLTRRERRVLASQKRRLPYMAHRKYQQRPTALWGHVKWFFGLVLARLLH